MAKTAEQQLKDLERQMREIKEAKSALKKQARDEAKREQTRRLILIGQFFTQQMEQMENDGADKALKMIKKFLEAAPQPSLRKRNETHFQKLIEHLEGMGKEISVERKFRSLESNGQGDQQPI